MAPLLPEQAVEDPSVLIAADAQYLHKLVRSSEGFDGKQWLELESLEMQRKEAKCRQRQISEEGSSRPENPSLEYWKNKANTLNELLADSLRRQEVLQQKLHDTKQLNSSDWELRKFLHFTLRNAPVSIAHLDKEFRYHILFNSFHDVLASRVLNQNREIKLRVIESRIPAMEEVTYDIPGVGPRTFLLYVHPVYARNQDFLGVNVIHIDVTEEIASRQKLMNIREQTAFQKAMQAEVQKRTQKTEQMIKAKQLLATMSHAIRSPLSGVVSIAELLSCTNLDTEQQQLVDVMVASGDFVLQLLDDIDLAKRDSVNVDETLFFPREIVKDALQIAAASLERSLHLEAFVSSEVPLEVVGDLLRFRRILTNLISNAIKFTHEGTVQVNLQVNPDHVREDAVISLDCEVMDTGIGIPASVLPLLFTQYTQASEAHHRKYGGTGLGLAICKQLVELMGGQLGVKSKENEGSTFYFTVPFKLPAKQSSNEDNGPFKFIPVMPRLSKLMQSPTFQAGCEQAAPSQLKVLLAEDNKVNVMIAQKMLRRFGLEAKAVDNGVDALQAVREEHYDLILMDVYMPHMDGLEATRLIREFQSTRNKRRSFIVAMTASTFDEAECYAEGVDSFVIKPVSFDKFKKVIEQVLN